MIPRLAPEYLIYIMLYAGEAVAALIAFCYLLFRRGNAFALDVTPPVRLRRWAAAFYAVAFLCHVWWYLFFIYSSDIHSMAYVVVCVLDLVTMLTTISGTLLAMLQDRKRPVWPVVIATIPYVPLVGLLIVSPSDHFKYIVIAYVLLLYVFFTIYMVFSVRQYGQWLRDNYADLEHKEVRLSYVLVVVFLLLIIIYGFDTGDLVISYLVQIMGLALFGFLLWRVETLQQFGWHDNSRHDRNTCGT